MRNIFIDILVQRILWTSHLRTKWKIGYTIMSKCRFWIFLLFSHNSSTITKSHAPFIIVQVHMFWSIYMSSSFIGCFYKQKYVAYLFVLGTGFSCMPPCLCCSMEFWLFWLFVRHSVKLHWVPIHLFLLQRASFPDIR